MKTCVLSIIAAVLVGCAEGDIAKKESEWVTRDKRWPPRGSWNWSVQNEIPDLWVEFNGIDFGHAHLAETLLSTQDPEAVERARLEVLVFIFSKAAVPPDEEQLAPTFVRMIWEAQKTFNWTHIFHRSLYDMFADDETIDKEAAYRELLQDYLEKPEAITSHSLDLHGKLWNFPESKAFRNTFPKFNSQIWAYHWLQAAAYDIQLMGPADRQRELFKPIIEHYHGYLHDPPLEWKMMPMMEEAAPNFSKRFAEAATIFNNLHMLHDNIDDVLRSPDLYPTLEAKRKAILRILAIYLHRNHAPRDFYEEYHAKLGEHGEMSGTRPPSAGDVHRGKYRKGKPEEPKKEEKHKHP